MISTGGTYLVEQYSLNTRLFEYQTAAALGIPVIFFNQSLGPFSARRNRKLLRPILERSPLILLRDEQSRANLRHLGVNGSHINVVADAVFLTGAERREFPMRRQATDPWRIGISVRLWPPGATVDHPQVRKFIMAMVEGVTHLARTLPASFTFISTCQGTPEYHIDDSSLAAHIVGLLPIDVRESVQVDNAFHTPAQFREILEGLDLLIATRMHAAIQSLTVGTPVVPIAYEFKTLQLAERLGISDYVLDTKSISGPTLISTVERFLDRLDDLRDPLATAVQVQRVAANRSLELLASTLGSLGR
jgi:colanic acid/amylovoran biosynthesis protein